MHLFMNTLKFLLFAISTTKGRSKHLIFCYFLFFYLGKSEHYMGSHTIRKGLWQRHFAIEILKPLQTPILRRYSRNRKKDVNFFPTTPLPPPKKSPLLWTCRTIHWHLQIVNNKCGTFCGIEPFSYFQHNAISRKHSKKILLWWDTNCWSLLSQVTALPMWHDRGP